MTTKTEGFHYPTSAEFDALEIAAHGARAQELARLFHAGAKGWTSLVAPLVAMLAARDMGHA